MVVSETAKVILTLLSSNNVCISDFFNFYRSIPGDFEREWSYSSTKEFITGNNKLPPEQKELLLQLVDLLESPKEKGNKKLKELEISIRTVLKLNDK